MFGLFFIAIFTLLQRGILFIQSRPIMMRESSLYRYREDGHVGQLSLHNFGGNKLPTTEPFGNIRESPIDELFAESANQSESKPELDCEKKPNATSSSFLWRISTQPYSHLFGTLHVAYTHVWPHIDPVVKDTFFAADHIYFELDLMDPATLGELANCQLLPQDKDLTDLLSPELINRLDSYITRTRLSMSRDLQHSNFAYVRYLLDLIAKDWKWKRPMWILFLLTGLTRGEIADRGVPVLDLFMAQLAQRLGKQWGAVEEVTDQCDPLNGVPDKQASLALKMTLDGLEMTMDQARSDQTYRQDAGFDSGSEVTVENNLHTSNKEVNSNNSGPGYFQPSSKQPPGSTSRIARNSKPVWKTAQRLIDQYNCGDISSLLLSDGIRQSIPSTFQSDAQLRFVTENTSQTLPPIRSFKNSPKHSQKPIQNVSTSERTLMKSTHPSILEELEEYLNKELIVKRNEKMATRIIRELNKARSQGKSAFFAIGAAHFIGSESTIIHYLQQAGYEITAVPRTLSEANRDKSIDGVELQDTDHLLRNRRKQTNSEELLNEYELPEFRPRFVNFENVWIRIEDFSPTVIASRRNQSRNGMSLEPDRQTPYDINVPKVVASPNKVLSKDSWKSPKKERQKQPTKNDSSSRSHRFCFTLFSLYMLRSFIVFRLA